jgi:CHAT domain-containing protein
VYLAFQRYRPFDGQKKYESRWSAPRYLALMLSKGGSAEVVDLGPSDLIDTLIRTALATTSSSGVTPDEIQAAWSSVNHELFPPSLQAKLQGSSRWILSPDGELSRIPFLALPSPLASTGSEQRLADIIDIQLVSSGRDLVSDPARTASQQAATPLVVANPSFGPSPHGPWKPLEASGREGQKIASILGVTPKLHSQASKAVVVNSPKPKVLHIASHGFFAAPSSTPAPAPKTSPGEPLRISFSGPPDHREDAMLNSAIVLAGVNRDPSTGTLTAREVAQLQLDGTELVVLSDLISNNPPQTAEVVLDRARRPHWQPIDADAKIANETYD